MINLKLEKDRLRKKFREIRCAYSEEQKRKFDSQILRRLISLYQYKTASLILTYVSKDIEVDTIMLIEKALSDGKRVAAPKCVAGTRKMDFYYINSLDDLEKSTFGVLEPIVDRCEKVVDFSNGFCIVPGMSFDVRGFRLGYGKGYYDRFLSDFSGNTAGLCYSECVKWSLPSGKYDRAVDVLVTERYFRKTNHRAEYRPEEIS